MLAGAYAGVASLSGVFGVVKFPGAASPFALTFRDSAASAPLDVLAQAPILQWCDQQGRAQMQLSSLGSAAKSVVGR